MMSEQRANWQQLLLQMLPAIVPASLAVIVGAFRDVFPPWAFMLLIIILALFLVIALFRLVLGDVITKLRRNFSARKRISNNRRLIISWTKKWNALAQLVSDCINQKEAPTLMQEEAFQQLHNWFIHNRSKFLPLWYGFYYHTRSQANHEHWDKYDPRTKMLHNNAADPFSVIYNARSLQEAILSWGLLEGGFSDHWLNTHQDKLPFQHALHLLTERLEELSESL